MEGKGEEGGKEREGLRRMNGERGEEGGGIALLAADELISVNMKIAADSARVNA